MNPKNLVHVVSFKFKPTATRDQISEAEQAFVALKSTIPGVESMEWGTNVSPENHAKGFTHGFVLEFATAEARDAYLIHPAHKAFEASLGPVLDDAFVIDFWPR